MVLVIIKASVVGGCCIHAPGCSTGLRHGMRTLQISTDQRRCKHGALAASRRSAVLVLGPADVPPRTHLLEMSVQEPQVRCVRSEEDTSTFQVLTIWQQRSGFAKGSSLRDRMGLRVLS